MSATARSTGAMRLAQNITKQPATSRNSFFALPAQQICQQRRPKSTGRRRLHSTSQKDVALPLSSVPEAAMSAPATSTMAPLSCLKLSEVLRSYLITTMSSSPTLLSASTNLLRQMLESKNPLLNLQNPLMRAVLFETFYKQFCAGWDAETIGARCKELRAQGYSGVILEYALEVLKDAQTDESKDIATWREGMLRTCDMAAEGDFLGLKWSGMGPAALQRMAKEQPPSKEMSEAMHALAKAASKKNIALLPSAEETWNLTGYHNWTLDMQREYNTNGKSVLYNTYQMYLKEAPKTIAEHLEISKAEGFTYGAKFVRGAYLASEPRHVIHDTIEDTHAAYDGATEAFIHRRYNDTIKPTNSGTTTFDNTQVVVASHNAATVEKAQELRRQQKKRGEELTPLVFAQLQGMADEVSCSLLAAAKNSEHDPNAVRERVFKCTTSGTMYQCLNYLLRRAAENKDAAGRTWETREAMQSELWRRMKGTFGLA